MVPAVGLGQGKPPPPSYCVLRTELLASVSLDPHACRASVRMMRASLVGLEQSPRRLLGCKHRSMFFVETRIRGS
jgi:hypothetical protein